MRKASRIYKRKSRSNLETLIILIGAIVVLGVAFYLARENSYIPPDTRSIQEEEKLPTATAKTTVEESNPLIPDKTENEETREIIPSVEVEPVEDAKPETRIPAPIAEKPAIDKQTSEKRIADNIETDKNEKSYTIQVGAFSNEKNAIKLAQEIKSKGYQTFVVKEGNLYKVQVEKFKTYKEAEMIAPKIKALGCPTFITLE